MPSSPPGSFASPHTLVLQVESRVHDLLFEYFTEHTHHSWDDASDAMVFAVADCGGETKLIGEVASVVTTILDLCMVVAPSIEAFRYWKRLHIALDQENRLRGAEATPVAWWPVAQACWLLTGAPDYAHSAARAVYAFRKHKIEVNQALDIVFALLKEPESSERRDFMELLERGALAQEDIKDSAAALATLHDPNLATLVARWRSGRRKQSLRKIGGKKICKELVRKPTHSVPERKLAEIPPNVQTAPPPATQEPTTLRGVLELLLPGNAQLEAGRVALALQKLKAATSPQDLKSLVAHIERMTGARGRTNPRIIEKLLKHLGKSNVLEKVGDGYRLCEESNHPVGSKILSMV